jgi:hypothetical protein
MAACSSVPQKLHMHVMDLTLRGAHCDPSASMVADDWVCWRPSPVLCTALGQSELLAARTVIPSLNPRHVRYVHRGELGMEPDHRPRRPLR